MNGNILLWNSFVGMPSCLALSRLTSSGAGRVLGCLSNSTRFRSTTCDAAESTNTSSYDRMIPKIKSELDAMKKRKFTQPTDPHFMCVSVLGTPNAGKSTLTNMLMGWRVCSVSKKVHTTQHNTKAILVDGNKQIVFLDTPGLVSISEKRRHHLDWEMLTDPKSSLAKTDLVIALIDVSNLWTRHRIDSKILELLEENQDKHTVLVMNKVDLVKSKKLLLELTTTLTCGVLNDKVSHAPVPKRHTLSMEAIIKRTERRLRLEQEGASGVSDDEVATASDQESSGGGAEAAAEDDDTTPAGWPHFREVFMVSALQNQGVAELRNYLLNVARPGLWQYSPNYVTDQEPQEIAIMAVREKLMDTLPAEIPYNIKLAIEIWEVDEHGSLRIAMLVNCPLKHHVKFVIGPQGKTVRQLALAARQELMNAFRCEVSLKLIVQHRDK